MESSQFNLQNPIFNSQTQLGNDNTMNVTNNNSFVNETAIEINQILAEISQSSPSNTTPEAIGNAASQRIKKNPTLYQKVISALKAGSTEAFAQLINHPAASFAIAALADWTK